MQRTIEQEAAEFAAWIEEINGIDPDRVRALVERGGGLVLKRD